MLVALGACLFDRPALAHHPVAVNYDTSTAITLRGMAAKIVFAAPHCYLWLDVKDDSGQVTHWVVEGDAAPKAAVAGLTRRMVPPGTIMTVTAFAAKANTSLVEAIPSAPQGVHEAAADGRLVHGIELQLPGDRTIVFGEVSP
jgi:hypothetical protein